jgi:probable rRNA maturation factor
VEERFKKIKDVVLGKGYDLSFAFINESEMRRLNRIYRGKDEPTDILSFPLSQKSGEIVMCKKKAAQKAKLYGRKSENFLYFLFIHGLVHLKGMDHGAIIEKEEEKFRKKFGI